jgi:hypothetical protein
MGIGFGVAWAGGIFDQEPCTLPIIGSLCAPPPARHYWTKEKGYVPIEITERVFMDVSITGEQWEEC